jgi:phosphoribosyl-dephospho-CoA transferase
MTYHPDGTKCRVNLLINSNLVLKIEEPLLLLKAMEVLPPNVYLTVNNFFDQFSNLPIIVRVYGSIMWSYEGNISRLNPNSDIDLLIQVTNSCDVDALADRLLKFSQLSKIFLDGEFEFKNGVFVSWREFTSGAKDLLAKTDSGPKLVTRNSVIEIAHT